MQIQLKHRLFSIVFLMIFFAKMAISVAPLLADHMDGKLMNAVIMQTELENNPETSKSAKDTGKSLFHHLGGHDAFQNTAQVLSRDGYYIENDSFRHLHYPSVPTQPPNV